MKERNHRFGQHGQTTSMNFFFIIIGKTRLLLSSLSGSSGQRNGDMVTGHICTSLRRGTTTMTAATTKKKKRSTIVVAACLSFLLLLLASQFSLADHQVSIPVRVQVTCAGIVATTTTKTTAGDDEDDDGTNVRRRQLPEEFAAEMLQYSYDDAHEALQISGGGALRCVTWVQSRRRQGGETTRKQQVAQPQQRQRQQRRFVGTTMSSSLVLTSLAETGVTTSKLRNTGTSEKDRGVPSPVSDGFSATYVAEWVSVGSRGDSARGFLPYRF